MSEDEDCDDLPMITVNTSAGDSSTFAMPSAEEVASQRARELECEEELLRLRERDLADELRRALVRSDSSGSEPDAQLAAAVTALSVHAPAAGPGAAGPGAAGPGAAGPGASPAAALWAALAPRLPPGSAAVAAALDPILRGSAHLQLHHIVDSVAATLGSEVGEWPDEEILCAGALLSVAVLARESQSRRAATRAMHALLDDHATAAQESELAILFLASFPSARTRLQLSDALRSGGDAGADRVAAAVTCASMLQLLEPGGAGGADGRARLADVARAAAAWRGAAPAAAYAAVQLAGRALAGAAPAEAGPSGAAPAEAGPSGAAPAEAGPARARLLAHLAPPPAAGLKLTPDRLKVLVSASKLKLLFRTEQ